MDYFFANMDSKSTSPAAAASMPALTLAWISALICIGVDRVEDAFGDARLVHRVAGQFTLEELIDRPGVELLKVEGHRSDHGARGNGVLVGGEADELGALFLGGLDGAQPDLVGIDKQGVGAVVDHGFGHLLAERNIIPAVGIGAGRLWRPRGRVPWQC